MDGCSNQKIAPGREWLAGGGETGEIIRSTDWSETPLGPIESWPQTLRTAVSICLGTRHPIVLWWGPERTMFYNDAYRPMLGQSKHPQFLGRSGQECWDEIWDIIGPMMDKVIETGEATWSEDLFLLMFRYGYLEETYFTFSYSPIRDEMGQPQGIFNACSETTARVLSERRLKTLREMLVEARTSNDAARLCADILGRNPRDIPFVLIYLLDAAGKQFHLAGQAGIEPGTFASPLVVEMASQDAVAWALGRVAASGHSEIVDNLANRFDCLPEGPWGDPPNQAELIPMTRPGSQQTTGVLVLGISSRRAFDDDYRGFFGLVAGHVATAVNNARAYEEEKQRSDKLAALDHAKTAFFSNVSHELRTPLTLMLGPLEDSLSHAEALPAADRDNLAVAHRSGLRLLKLVNTLLEFSRIEAGRVQALYEPTDLAGLTRDLASVFRSAIERSGLELLEECPSLAEPVFVDRNMWEKVVLNLLSNAVKFTRSGRITLRQRIVDNHLTLSVEDTGCGIPSSELGNVFKRFYRVEGTEGRTYEGTGIGLSLVQELVNLHGGTISAESMEGQGSTFTVSIPTGKDHLPADHIGGDRPLVPAGIRVDAFVEEALGWAPGLSKETIGEDGKANSARGDHSRLRILLADDNADMRDYVSKLLLAAYDVEKVADGEEAWNAICARRPDLLLTDVMMPNLDGFGLLARIRGSAETRSLPVILLSARAGEESRLGGLEAGADDYLIKPFSARELAARVRSNLEVAKLRQESVRVEERLKAEERLSVTLQSIGDAVISTDHIGRIEFMNEVAQVLTGWRLTEARGQNLNNIFNIVQEVTRIKPENPVAKVIRSGNVVGLANHTVLIRRDGSEIPIDDSAAPIRNKDGAIEGVVLVFHDISARRKSEKALRDNDRLATTGRLAASIAHEINNPLSAVGNLLYLVAQEAEEDSIVRQYVAMASQELGRVSQITQQMLTFQREAAKPTPVRISDVVENVLALFERKIVSAGIQIEKRIEFDGQILALPGELRQAVANLTGNAIEALAAFTNGKTGKLMIHLYSSREWRNGMAGLRVVVADNGPGISGDIRERIFEPFFTTKGESGTGLGLWITADIISKYGGTLRLRSSTQPHLSGSCFSVFFPLDGK